MSIDFNGQVAVVTGAGGGLGRCHALYLASHGAKVVVNDLGGYLDGQGDSQSPANKVVKEIHDNGGSAVPDFNSVAEHKSAEAIIETALAHFGRIDILICNAGIMRDKTFLKMPIEDFDFVIKTHLMGTVYTVKAAFKHMVKQNYGRLVFTGSSAGLFGNFGQTNYCAAKMGIVGFMNALKLEGLKYNILVNTVSPFATTRLTEHVDLFPEDIKHKLKPELVSSLVAYLCSRDCQLTGEIFVAGGGFYSRAQMMEGAGIKLKPSPIITPEEVAENLDQIMSMSEANSYFNADEAFAEILGL